MSNEKKHHLRAVWFLICLQFLLGLGALGGGGVLMAAPDGSLIQMPLSMLEHSPFSSFLISGVILFSLLGIYPVAVAYSLWQQPAWRLPEALNPFKHLHWSWAASLASGIMLESSAQADQVAANIVERKIKRGYRPYTAQQ